MVLNYDSNGAKSGRGALPSEESQGSLYLD